MAKQKQKKIPLDFAIQCIDDWVTEHGDRIQWAKTPEEFKEELRSASVDGLIEYNKSVGIFNGVMSSKMGQQGPRAGYEQIKNRWRNNYIDEVVDIE